MGDDFDLFPKRENLDPFSFGKKEKSSEKDKAESGEELFGQSEPESGELPDLGEDLSGQPPLVTPEDASQLPEIPLEGQKAPPESPAEKPLSEPPPVQHSSVPATGAEPDYMSGILADGPISEEKTFDEPVLQQPTDDDQDAPKRRKSASPFIVVSGALIIIIGLLYGALTYLKNDKPQVPRISQPQVSVPVPPVAPQPAPAPEAVAPEAVAPEEPSTAVEVTAPEAGSAGNPEQAASIAAETAPETAEPGQPTPAESPPAESVQPAPEPAPAADGAQYSVQVGAFILDSSVAELEKKLRGLGYEPILKKGSTTAMMNMLTVGPFANAAEARQALAKLKDSGVDSNMRQRSDGTAIINAGSYLLEENATNVMKKVRSLGYPVRMSKNEARLPMTFVRVGQYEGMEEANGAKGELEGKGLDGIVVKLQ
ncbi:MAG: SPOR domain-containing protein [Pseudomonadota bacterium]|jgi:cell division septation protein DedD